LRSTTIVPVPYNSVLARVRERCAGGPSRGSKRFIAPLKLPVNLPARKLNDPGIVKDRIRLWKQGIRDLVMELCCVLHNFRVRLTPWQPMI
jgi:hypothetical protein